MKKKFITYLLMFAMIVTNVLGPMGQVFAEDLSGQLVANVNFDKVTYSSHGERPKASISLSHDQTHGEKVKSGDQIKLVFDKSPNVTIKTQSATIPLKIEDGSIIGEAEISNTGITISFNEVVESLESFSAQAWFQFGLENSSTESGQVSLGNGSFNVEGREEGQTGGSNPDKFISNKSGSFDDNDESIINWDLIINDWSSSLADLYGNIEIVDELEDPDNHEIIKDSVYLMVLHSNGQIFNYADRPGFADLDYYLNYRGGSLRVESNRISLSLRSDLIARERIILRYQTRIINEDMKTYGNKYNVRYNEYVNGELKEENINDRAYVERYDFGASASGRKPKAQELKVIKLDSKLKEPIEGVKFKLEKIKGDEKILISDALVTDKDGIFFKKDLEPGDYILTEIEAPEQVDFEEVKKEFTIEKSSKEGITLEVENKLKKHISKDIQLRKKWLDEDGKELKDQGLKASFKLMADGEELETIELSSPDWEHTFKELPKYNDKNEEILYDIEEVEVEGYETSLEKDANSFNFTNKKKIKKDEDIEEDETIDINVEKKWVLPRSEEKRPVVLELYRSLGDKEESIAEISLDHSNDWKHTFESLEKYDENGNEYKYSISEPGFEEFYTEVSESQDQDSNINFLVTNKFNQVKLRIKKYWKNTLESEKVKLKFDIIAKTESYERVLKTVEMDSPWSDIELTLPKYDEEGQEISYDVVERPLDKFFIDSKFRERNQGYDYEYQFTNTSNKIQVEKKWFGGEKDKINISILQNNKLFKEDQISKDDGWYKEYLLPIRDEDGKAYEYRVVEEFMDDFRVKYDYDCCSNKFTISNISNEEIDLVINKSWIGKKADQAKFNIYRNGSLFKTLSITEEDNWTYKLPGLKLYSDQGIKIHYSVKEVAMEGYETSLEVDGNIFNFSNKEIKPDKPLDPGKPSEPELPEEKPIEGGDNKTETVEISLKKEWKYADKKDQNKYIPQEIQVGLFNDNEGIPTIVSLNEANNWSFKFENLSKYNNKNQLINYYVKEINPPKWVDRVEYKGSMDQGFTIYNIKDAVKPEPNGNLIDLPVRKVWADNIGLEDRKPVRLKILTEDANIKEQIIELSEDNNWSGKFTKLPEFSSNGKVNYSILELDSEKYDVEIKFDSESGFTVTNTLKETEKPVVPEEKPLDPEEPKEPEVPEEKPLDPEDPKEPEVPEEKPLDPEDPKEPELPEEKPHDKEIINKPDTEKPIDESKNPITPERPSKEDTSPVDSLAKLPKTGSSSLVLLVLLGFIMLFIGFKLVFKKA